MNQDVMPILGVALAFLCVLAVVLLVLAIFFLLTLQKALNRCSPRNRAMEPGLVWLNLIPIFQLFWSLYTVFKIGTSLKQEFADRDLDEGGDYGKTIGLVGWVLYIVGSVVGNVGGAGQQFGEMNGLALVGLPISIVALVLWIVYWVRIYGYSKRLETDDLHDDDRDYDDRDDDRDDDRPRRPRRGPMSTDIRSKEKDDRYS